MRAMYSGLALLTSLALAACATEPTHDPGPGEYGSARHFLFGWALVTGVPREKAGCVVDEVMKDMSPAEIDRVEALAAGHQKPNKTDMVLMERIALIGKGGRQPSIEAAIAAECRLDARRSVAHQISHRSPPLSENGWRSPG